MNTLMASPKLWTFMNGPKNFGQKTDDPVCDAISRYSDHPSIIKIRDIFPGNSFEFTNTDTETVHKVVMSLNLSLIHI